MRVFATFSLGSRVDKHCIALFSARDHTLPRDREGYCDTTGVPAVEVCISIYIYMDVFVVVTHSVSVLCAIAIGACSATSLLSGRLLEASEQ